MFFYCADLIMIGKYHEASEIIDEYGEVYEPLELPPRWQGKRLRIMKEVFLANMLKLHGLALLKQDMFDDSMEKFRMARDIFWDHGIMHGVASCELALAKLNLDGAATAHLDKAL